MSVSTVKVEGLRELDLALKVIDKEFEHALKAALKAAAEPVAADAQQLARARISRLGEPWSLMRVGATASLTLVYVAPVARGRLSRQNPRLHRPNLAALLLGRAMEPALERNEARVAEAVGKALDLAGRRWGSI